MPLPPSQTFLSALLAFGAGIAFPASGMSQTTEAVQQNELAASAGASRPSEELLALGRQVFTEIAEPQCAVCHTLTDAGATGKVGPNLDDLPQAQDIERVRAAVLSGVGVMPAYKDLLTKEQIDAVVTYVATVAENGGAATEPQ